MWASDSLFLKEFLLIPSGETSNINPGTNADIASPSDITSPSAVSSSTSISSLDCDNVDDFLNKIDKAIAITKEDVKKTSRNSE